MTARFSSAGSSRWYLARKASKLQRGPSWLSSTPSTSKGMASSSAASLRTSFGAAKRNTGSLSMKRAMSQGQAMRSTLGCSRVIHFTETSSADAARPLDESWAGRRERNTRDAQTIGGERRPIAVRRIARPDVESDEERIAAAAPVTLPVPERRILRVEDRWNEERGKLNVDRLDGI